MIYQIKQSPLAGEIYVVPSKSIMHRALIAASLCDGHSIIKNPLFAVDTLQTMDGLKNLGVLFETRLDEVIVLGDSVRHTGIPINARESGSTLRFLIPVSLLTQEKEHFVLSPSLVKRPMSPYEDAFKAKGIYYEQKDNNIYCQGPLKAGDYVIPGDVSSQFISGLLFVLPILDGNSKIVIKGNYESKSYVDLTINILKAFQIQVIEKHNVLFIQGNQKYLPTNIEVESDYSQAAFFLVAAALGHDITIKGLNKSSLQGDKSILDFLNQSGCKVNFEQDVTVEKTEIKATTFDISNTPDLGPILFALAALSNAEITIKGIKRLRYKESDRIKAMCENLTLIGSKFLLKDNEITFYPSQLKGGVKVSSFNDHRIVMSMAIIATLIEGGLIIDGIEAVNKSYPTFFEDLRFLGAKIYEIK
ncbi:MAG: 3-phosphoshikimate 1-carboxyvinyltransferase [Acholeplasmataceae bacterium]|jgi:3-phosphoshikimate 1-carboxyvinyltransferase|nr:3-phosphoshikimate 1-carboxyvinyltransferase [Acholeplasmataceae bacterium]